MTIHFTTSNQFTENSGVKGLIYGDAGMGKTMLACTAPRPLVLAVEAGMLSLRTKNIERLFGVGTPGITYDVPAIIINSMADLNEAFTWLTSPAGLTYFDTLYMDSLSEIAEVVLSSAKASYKDPRQAYGELITAMEVYIRSNIKLTGKHVFMTAKIEPVKNELTGVVNYLPMMPGSKLGPKLAYMYDEVFRLFIARSPDGSQQYRALQTQPDIQYIAKDRSGALAALEPPNLTHVISKILGA